MAHSGDVSMSTASRVTRARGVCAVKVLACIVAMSVVNGCSSARIENDSMKNAFDALMKRPSLSVIEADYQSMYETIRSRLVAEVSISPWLPDREPIHGTSCGGDLSHLDDGAERLYNAGSSSGNLPDARWEQAVAIVTEVAGQHGFGPPEVVVSGPGDHEVELHDRYGGSLTFGTGYNTILFGGTGCHLTEKAHQRGTYLPPKHY
jgi:hypothetical protein